MSRRKNKAGALESDSRWTDKESKSLAQLSFPDSFKQSVDLRKVQMQVIRPWITARVTELLGIEDDVVAEYATSLLEDPTVPSPDPRKLQVALMGFLDQHAAVFVEELWKLLLSAQQSIGGIPQEFVERKKKELEAQRAAERAAQSSRGGHPSERDRDRGGTAAAAAAAGPSRRGDGPQHRHRGPPGGRPREAQDYDSRRREGGPSGPAERYGADRRRYDDRDYGQRRYEGGRSSRDDRYRDPPAHERSYRHERGGRGRSRSRSHSRTRSISRSRSRSPPPRRRYADRSPSRSRSRLRSPSPRRDSRYAPRRRSRSRSRSISRSRSPPPRDRPSGHARRDAYDEDDDGDRRGKYSRRRSPSRTPPYRRERRSRSRSRSWSPPPPLRRRERSISPADSRTPTPAEPHGRSENPEDRERELREQLMAKRARAA
ncbi:hypothetical protein V8E36_007718 [Tilletia maclaganii]